MNFQKKNIAFYSKAHYCGVIGRTIRRFDNIDKKKKNTILEVINILKEKNPFNFETDANDLSKIYTSLINKEQ